MRGLGAAFAVVAIAAPSHADDAPPAPAHASMQCDRAIEPGRVRCSVEVHADPGRSIAWADVVIVSLPDFASALKGRIGREDTTVKEPTEIKWAFGLVAKRAGTGDAKARVRLSICDAAAKCVPIVLDVRAALSVGG